MKRYGYRTVNVIYMSLPAYQMFNRTRRVLTVASLIMTVASGVAFSLHHSLAAWALFGVGLVPLVGSLRLNLIAAKNEIHVYGEPEMRHE